MGAKTNISWADRTFNPWIGCQKVGLGCDSCYAETWDSRFDGARWGPHAARTLTGQKNWNLPLRWNREAEAAGRLDRVFCASLGDVFDNHISIQPEWRTKLGTLIRSTPNIVWLLLTKRIGNADRMLGQIFGSNVPENVWIGATVVNQVEADRDIPTLLKLKSDLWVSRVFLSMEPLLSDVRLTRLSVSDVPEGVFYDALTGSFVKEVDGSFVRVGAENVGSGLRGAVDWVIVGGETGKAARPMHPGWVRSLRDQCERSAVAFHFKQWGEWKEGSDFAPDAMVVLPDGRLVAPDRASMEAADREAVARGGAMVRRVGKIFSGRSIDGKVWDEVPAVPLALAG